MAVLILLESDGETYAVLTEQVDVGALKTVFFLAILTGVSHYAYHSYYL